MKGVNFLKNNDTLRSILNEYSRLVKILMTISGSSCINEKSFSALNCLKSYLRFTMSHNRLNNSAIIQVNQEYIEKLDLSKVINTFIDENT